jgi:hypothetical protein
MRTKIWSYGRRKLKAEVTVKTKVAESKKGKVKKSSSEEGK